MGKNVLTKVARFAIRSIGSMNERVNTEIFMFQGDYIWIEPISGREFDVAIGARVISAEGRRIQVKDDDNKVITHLIGLFCAYLETKSLSNR